MQSLEALVVGVEAGAMVAETPGKPR